MKTLSLFILVVFIISACTGKKVEITNEYIINENWSKKGEQILSNSITITKMKLLNDSTIDPFSNLHQSEILSKFELDSSFMHYAQIKIKDGESYEGHKIYFNRDNGFYWGRDRNNHSDTTQTKTIGLLQAGSWYEFSDLGLLTYSSIYIYIDSSNKTHRFNITASNY